MRVAGLGLLTGTSLFLEVVLTRYLSVLYYPPYVFTVISLAILGIGIGAALAAWQTHLRIDSLLGVYSVLAGFSVLILVAYSVLLAQVQPLLFPLVMLPFLFVGLAVSTVFSLHPHRSTRLYMIDLIGAGVGAAAAIPVMNLLGAQNALLIAAVGFALTGLCYASYRRAVFPIVLIAAAALITLTNFQTGWLAVDFTHLPIQKPITKALAGDGKIIETRWDAFARTDLVKPADGGPYQLFVDGAAGSVMPPAEDTALLIQDLGFFPFATAQPARVLVIGPGGGLDVAFGRFIEAQQITAVEVNPESVALVRDYGEYNGQLYDNPQIDVLVDEGRSVLRRSNRRYDLIFLSQVITEVAERSGYALTENTIYTVEAFQEYLDHLTPDGQLALKLYDEPTLTRALSLAVAALQKQGMSDMEALQHTAAFLDPRSNVPLLMVQKQRFSHDDALALGAVAKNVGFVPLYLPGVVAQPPLDAVESGKLSFAKVIADSGTNIAPTTDNRPYFFQFERGLPSTLLPLVIGAVALAIAGGLWLMFQMRRANNHVLGWAPFYFACLGIGFICIEIAVIQHTRLFLGSPVYAVTVVLTTILVGGGAGSLASGAWLDIKPFELSAMPVIGVAIFAPLWVLAWNSVSPGLLAREALIRFGFVIALLFPLAVLMGIPFPTGLRALSDAPGSHIALAWAVNGITTVIGSVIAVAISVLFGFNAILWLGIGMYGLAAVFAYVASRVSKGP